MIEREKAPDDDDEGSGGDRRECHVAAAALYSQGPNYASIVVVVALNGAGAWMGCQLAIGAASESNFYDSIIAFPDQLDLIQSHVSALKREIGPCHGPAPAPQGECN